MAQHDLESLTGIGPTTAQVLVAAGFADRDAIAAASVEELVAVKGFGATRASSLIAEAQSTVEAEESAASEPSKGTTTDKPVDKQPREPSTKKRKKLRARHADLKSQAKKARKKSKTASSKKKRKRWAAEADRLAKKAKKAKKRLARLG